MSKEKLTLSDTDTWLCQWAVDDPNNWFNAISLQQSAVIPFNNMDRYFSIAYLCKYEKEKLFIHNLQPATHLATLGLSVF